jgi:hypothetical protein
MDNKGKRRAHRSWSAFQAQRRTAATENKARSTEAQSDVEPTTARTRRIAFLVGMVITLVAWILVIYGRTRLGFVTLVGALLVGSVGGSYYIIMRGIPWASRWLIRRDVFLLSATARWIAQFSDFSEELLGYAVWLIAAQAFVIVTSVASNNLVLNAVGLIVVVEVFYRAVSRVSTAERRIAIYGKLASLGWQGPVAYALLIVILALTIFSALSVMLSAKAWLAAGSTEASNSMTWMSFYLWEFADAIPVLEVTKTLSWEPSLTYNDARMGSLVLLFKLTAILPTVAMLTDYWRYRRGLSESGI